MMCGKIAMCVDSVCLRNPSSLGLPDETLESQGWISTFSEGASLRAHLRSGEETGEVWVFSCDDVEAINAAAAVKKDNPDLPVYLVSFEGGGSLRSRAQAAGLDGVLDRAQFSARYSFRKCSASRLGGSRHPTAAREAVCREQPTAPLPAAGLAIAMESEFLKGMDLGKLAEGAPKASSGEARGARPSSGKDVAPCGKKACLIAVASASGGSGKSTLSALVAVLSAGMGFKTLALDGDLQFGDVHLLLGEESPCRIDDVVLGSKPIPQPRQDGEPAVIASPERSEVSEAVARSVEKVIDDACSAYDVVVVNTGSLWAEQHAAVFEKASSVLMLVSQSSSSLAATKRAVDMLQRCGVPISPLKYVLNGCKRGAPLSSIDVSCSLKGAPVFELRDGGRDVDELMAAGLATELVEDENPLCVSVEALLDELLPGQSSEVAPERFPKPSKGRFSRLRRRVSCLC